jgi:hypothetical protein
VPARRLRGQFVALTAVQWEVVANADRRRSPIDLARLLGRDAFTVMLEVRRMAGAGLVEPGRPAGSAVAESAATVRAWASVPVPTPRPLERHSKAPAPEPPPILTPPGEPLPRRVVSTDVQESDGFEPVYSDELLLRIRAGLAALR